jgi:hypothetical protein
MDNNLKIVTQIPLTNLWNEYENHTAKRNRYLTANDILEIFKKYKSVKFVIADVGKKLDWKRDDNIFDFWKTNVKPHLSEDICNFHFDDFNDNYKYIASEWIGEVDTPIILLEKYH